MLLFRVKVRHRKTGRILRWEKVTEKDVFSHKYYKNFFFGRLRRRIALKSLEIVDELKKSKKFDDAK